MVGRIVRLETNLYYGTFGTLILDTEVFSVTLEPYDRDNAKSISNIPAQQYICKRIKSPRYGWTFEVMGVQWRSHVLFHPGNFSRNTKACIILAQHYGKLQGERAVLNSGNTFKRFMEKMKGINKFPLTITESY